ncbi:exosome nuclease subunit [Knufia peltigerae]|uniref:Exosome nuclease subunit n=1 Tax=Knufia peltigerae TaxID=1002370 RepID=A0AA39CSJ0_9EURO|nr:exosome nuclease subunit [Knufia peltigerae]
MASEESHEAPVDLTADFKSFQDQVQSALVNVTRTAGRVSNEDLGFHRSSSEKLSRALDRQNAHLLRLTNKLLKAATTDTSIKPPTLQSPDGIDDNWRRVVDIVDDLLEKADSALDEVSGVIKRHSPSLKEGDAPSQNAKLARDRFSHVMQKPQVHFEKKVNNHETKPFKPLLRSKPHAKVPLEECVGEEQSGYKHPYAPEIEDYTYPPSVYETSSPIPFNPPENTEPIYVDTEEGVKEMLEELKQATEIAIDLEHHDTHSFIGIVCLMQVSTREKDWIIDTLKPWRENLQMLNEVLADPKILKVFHGSNMDMIWLQRDLGLYVVGLFDTFHASMALQFNGKGLRHLLERFANFEAQKQYQTADWRVRPLPKELIDYARSDTHFLLHIYDNMRNMLIESSTPNENLVDYVLRESKKESLQVYERPVYDAETGRGSLGWLNLLMQRSVSFGPEQLSVFRAVHEWRDRKARETDEGLQFIMPNHIIFQIAESMPTSAFTFHATVRRNTKAISNYLPELIEIVKKAKAEGKEGKTVQEVLKHAEDVYGIVPRRGPRYWPRQQQQQQTTFEGVGATLQKLVATAANESVSSSASLAADMPIAKRSTSSRFWGTITPQHAHIATETTTAFAALASVLPLHTAHISDKLSQQPTEPAPDNASQPAVSAEKDQPQPSQQPKSKEIFTLKERSRSRKRKAGETDTIEDEPATTSPNVADDSVSINQDQEVAHEAAQTPDPAYADKRLAKKQKKAEKKARKQAEKLAAEQAAQETKPFDYAGAESLLTPAAQPAPNTHGTKKMNPFAKALDTSTGARRSKMGKEMSGKSMTFKS